MRIDNPRLLGVDAVPSWWGVLFFAHGSYESCKNAYVGRSECDARSLQHKTLKWCGPEALWDKTRPSWNWYLQLLTVFLH